MKRELLAAIAATPWGSPRRRAAFLHMHRQLEILRSAHVGAVEREQRRLEAMRRAAADDLVASRRDWAFPLYPAAALDDLAERVRGVVSGAEVGTP